MKEKSNIPFYKMQGTGNDFVVIDNRQKRYPKEKLIKLAPRLCDRKYGVGADGLMALQNARLPDTDYEMLYRNADGSDAGMCGNGSRCLALLASRLGMGRELTFSVHDQIYKALVTGPTMVRITFPTTAKVRELDLEDSSQVLYQVYTGTEHIVKEVPAESLKDEKMLSREGRRLRHYPDFRPKGTNVNFFHGLKADTLSMQTYERGVEELTLACGTGAIASALAWHHIRQGSAGYHETVTKTPGGELNIAFNFDDSGQSYNQIRLSGPAELVFEGSFYV